MNDLWVEERGEEVLVQVASAPASAEAAATMAAEVADKIHDVSPAVVAVQPPPPGQRSDTWRFLIRAISFRADLEGVRLRVVA